MWVLRMSILAVDALVGVCEVDQQQEEETEYRKWVDHGGVG